MWRLSRVGISILEFFIWTLHILTPSPLWGRGGDGAVVCLLVWGGVLLLTLHVTYNDKGMVTIETWLTFGWLYYYCWILHDRGTASGLSQDGLFPWALLRPQGRCHHCAQIPTSKVTPGFGEMAVVKTLSLLLKTIIWAFSDGLVLKISGAHCCGPCSISAQGSEIPKAVQQGEKKNPKTNKQK